MKGLTTDQIVSLYAKQDETRTRATTKHTHIVRGPEGLVVLQGKPFHEVVGGFTGKQGTTVRSRKGRTYRKPNGSRSFMDTQMWSEEHRIIMY